MSVMREGAPVKGNVLLGPNYGGKCGQAVLLSIVEKMCIRCLGVAP